MVPDAELPGEYILGPESRGGKFTLSVGDPPLIRDIPVDPPRGQLVMTKRANKAAAAIGELVSYRLEMTNEGGAPVREVRIADRMPHGFHYLSDTTVSDGASVAEPAMGATGAVEWQIAELAPGATVALGYGVLLGPDSHRGSGINRVQAFGTAGGVGNSQQGTVASMSPFMHVESGGVMHAGALPPPPAVPPPPASPPPPAVPPVPALPPLPPLSSLLQPKAMSAPPSSAIKASLLIFIRSSP